MCRSFRSRSTLLTPDSRDPAHGHSDARDRLTTEEPTEATGGGEGLAQGHWGWQRWYDARACYGLQMAAPIGRSPLTALPLNPLPPIGGGAHRPLTPPVPSLSLLGLSFPLYFPFLPLGTFCQRSPRTVPVPLPRVGSTWRRAPALAIGQGRPSGYPLRWGTPTGRGGGGRQGCIGTEEASEAAPEAVRQAVGGGCQSGWGRLLSVTNAIEAGTWRQGDSGWAEALEGGGGYPPLFPCSPRGGCGASWLGCVHAPVLTVRPGPLRGATVAPKRAFGRSTPPQSSHHSHLRKAPAGECLRLVIGQPPSVTRILPPKPSGASSAEQKKRKSRS